MIGLSALGCGVDSTMPQIAPAARVRISREIRLIPATSTILGNITMSFTPTYWAVFPLASVETITLGNPIGRARIAAVPIAVPPPPPSEMTPSIFFSAASRPSTRGAPFDIAATVSPRSRRATSAPRFIPAAAAISCRVTSGLSFGSPSAPTSMINTWCPRSLIRLATKACSSPLVSIVPRIAIVAIRGWAQDNKPAGKGMLVSIRLWGRRCRFGLREGRIRVSVRSGFLEIGGHLGARFAERPFDSADEDFLEDGIGPHVFTMAHGGKPDATLAFPARPGGGIRRALILDAVHGRRVNHREHVDVRREILERIPLLLECELGSHIFKARKL